MSKIFSMMNSSSSSSWFFSSRISQLSFSEFLTLSSSSLHWFFSYSSIALSFSTFLWSQKFSIGSQVLSSGLSQPFHLTKYSFLFPTWRSSRILWTSYSSLSCLPLTVFLFSFTIGFSFPLISFFLTSVVFFYKKRWCCS